MDNGANKTVRNPVSVTPFSNTPEYSNDFIILVISFIYPFEINNVNPFPAITAPFPLTLLLNLFIAFEGKLLANPYKVYLAKETGTCVTVFS